MFKLWQRVIAVPSWLLIAAVRGYQLGVSPFIGPRCRFQPTCSQYFIEAVRKYGAIRGSWRGLCRIGRCHPWGGNGYDPP
jgi:putative membrane protein insertion efficiency factor